jgi:hypothetical protein
MIGFSCHDLSTNPEKTLAGYCHFLLLDLSFSQTLPIKSTHIRSSFLPFGFWLIAPKAIAGAPSFFGRVPLRATWEWCVQQLCPRKETTPATALPRLSWMIAGPRLWRRGAGNLHASLPLAQAVLTKAECCRAVTSHRQSPKGLIFASAVLPLKQSSVFTLDNEKCLCLALSAVPLDLC